MDKRKIQKLIKLLTRAGVLKNVPRTGWVLKGVKDAESVADHTWRMSLLVSLLTPRNLDRLKLLEMCVIHDLGEIDVGDTVWEKGKKVIGSQPSKRRAELKVMKNIFGTYPDGKKYIKLLKEFNENKTPEARFLKKLDKFEMALQALEYEQKGHSSKKLNEFWENAEKYLVGQGLEPIFKELQKMRKKKT